MFGFYSFHLKKLKIIELIFELAPGSKILVVNNKDNRVFMSRKYIGLIVASWKFDVLKFKLAYLFQEHQTSVGQLSADSSATETLRDCLNG